MRKRIRAAAFLAAMFIALTVTSPAHAQGNPTSDVNQPPSSAPVSREEFERRMKDIDEKYKQDLAQRDKAIAELRAELAKRPASQDQALEEERAKAHEEHVRDLLEKIDTGQVPGSVQRNPVSFNPDFAVVSDFLGTWSNNRSNDALNRFDVREVELDLRAAVDPRADAVAIIAIPRDVANPLFPTGEVPEGPDAAVELEEAYLFFHDFGVDNLTAKLGRFHVRFGRQNILHLHDLPTSDPPLANQAFLAPEALSDSGLSLSYVIPNPWNQYFEIVAEILAGEGAGSESPTLTGDLSVDSPAINLHALWNTDICRDWNMEIGGSWLHGHSSADNSQNVDLFGGDFTLLHTDPTGGFNNQVFQAEVMHGIIDQLDGTTQRGWGAYLLGQQQINKDWYFGARLDWTQDPNNDSQEAWAISPYVSWYWSEFLRFRVEYQHLGGDVKDQDVVMFQVTWIFGAHPPHPYWAMR